MQSTAKTAVELCQRKSLLQNTLVLQIGFVTFRLSNIYHTT